MPSIEVKPLAEGLAFGARVAGVTFETLADEAVRKQLNAVFEDRGLIVFENVEPSGQMHVAISNVFGPLKDHPVPSVARVDQDGMPGVIDMRHGAGEGAMVEIDGKAMCSWLPWHFDHCYNNELNRAGVLRAIDIAPEGGMTGFADGVQVYNDFDPTLRAKAEELEILYTVNTSYDEMRFGRPAGFKVLRTNDGDGVLIARAKAMPRAIHPAVWTRASGEKVLHVSPWMSVGVNGHEDPQGDALYEAICQELIAKVKPYYHRWNQTDMLIWDNWRMLHSVSGMDPKHPRRMQRTTIRGDYGLGRFENDAVGGDPILEMTV
jgi:taurine dioxygenase